jgi:hypothetical protein
MRLSGELLTGKFQSQSNLDAEFTRPLEAERIKRYLGNGRVVRHHHGHWSEESLEVVWQLSSSCVAGVHRDEDCAAGIEHQGVFFKSESCCSTLSHERSLDLENLGSHYRQNFNFDPVELVEAGPGSAASQAAEELAHGINVQLVRAVEH